MGLTSSVVQENTTRFEVQNELQSVIDRNAASVKVTVTCCLVVVSAPSYLETLPYLLSQALQDERDSYATQLQQQQADIRQRYTVLQCV